ncbi:threonine ammonia-lyase ILV1 [Ascoidea rubescens DSM 1968]|uniref:Threonine dehydratase n=1 Tax=Ascoidea rubescens DSM 1968 TaxID=1344418 RepID=A0A1D2VCR9_9ASCO|nr:threonine dehydratase I [Ascoidea rubescens DSM 1968]ODV59267.1 threonine dehydratase I [Ascoidea rubescens DSM 1968]
MLFSESTLLVTSRLCFKSTLASRSLRPSHNLSARFQSTTRPRYPDLQPNDLLPDGTPDYVRLILTSRVYDVIDESPITNAVSLSAKTNAKVVLKREDLLPVFSFKLRGAYNMIANLPAEKRSKGVIACSAGNHAQGVAFSSKHLKIPSIIVMPTATPSIKYENVSRLGSQVVLFGDDFDGAKSECTRLTKERNLTNIPPFDHPLVIAGQGTIAMELLRQIKSGALSAVFCAVGGGGLAAGISSYLKRIAPHVKIIGVETFDADALYQSKKADKKVLLSSVGSFADGTAVKEIGDETFRVCLDNIDEVVRVNTDEICAAIKDVFEDTRSVVEPSGAMTVAGLKRYIAEHPEIDHSTKTYVPILSGANMNFDRLRFVSERAVLGEGKEVFMLVTIPDIPGSFQKLQSVIHPRSVTEFSYRYNDRSASNATPDKPSDACIYTSFSVNNRGKEVAEVLEGLDKIGFSAIDISDNEIAKSHGRYLVGGTAHIEDERLLSFEFPEKPGALTKFLENLKGQFNLTLFHYRNHGSDMAQILTGIVIPKKDDAKFQQFLDTLNYKYTDVTDNIIAQKFLRA